MAIPNSLNNGIYVDTQQEMDGAAMENASASKRKLGSLLEVARSKWAPKRRAKKVLANLRRELSRFKDTLEVYRLLIRGAQSCRCSKRKVCIRNMRLESAARLAERTSVAYACQALGLSRSTYYEWRKKRLGESAAKMDRKRGQRGYSQEQRRNIFETIDASRFRGMSIAQIFATLFDEGRYLCSLSTMYRIAREARQPKHRRVERGPAIGPTRPPVPDMVTLMGNPLLARQVRPHPVVGCHHPNLMASAC